LACLAIVVTFRARDGAAYASRPGWTSALPCRNRLSRRRASVCAVAVMALGGPRRPCSRRKQAPKALWEWCNVRAARRRATVTRGAPGRPRRDRTVPPDIWGWGHRPSQLQPWCTLGPRCLAVPISLRRSHAVLSSIPAMVVRSTPARRESGVRASNRGALVCLGRRGLGGKGGPALGSCKVARGAVLC
jgi:hypothetical protein